MSNLLEYIEPRKFIDAERKFCSDFSAEQLLPEETGYRGGTGIRGYTALDALCGKNRPAFGRAIAAWYLKASGLSYAAIGELFEISASRAGSIVKNIRKDVYSPEWAKKQWDEVVMRRAEKQLFPTVSLGVQKAHRATRTFVQMRDVESLMYSPHASQYALYSGALRLGRARFQKQRSEAGAYRCLCDDCKGVALPDFEEKVS